MAELILQNLTKVFATGERKVAALEDLSLSARSGELIVLLGPSGSGKSTALRLIAGLETPDRGSVSIGGENMDGKPARERKVSMAFQYPALLPQLTVRANIELGLRLRKTDAREMSRRVDRLVAPLGLAELLDRKPETLSGGQQQRVALARALAVEPQVLLLDEPLANLDPLARTELREIIRRVQRELGLTTVYVTHDQWEATAIADRIAVLHEGKLQQFDRPAALYENPGNLFVARFIGPDPLNCLGGQNVHENGHATFCSNHGLRIALSTESSTTIGTATAGFRPSSVKLAAGTLQGLITEVLDSGWKRLASIDCNGESIWLQLAPADRVSVGETVSFGITSLFLFDSATGVRKL